ncbi:Transportin-3 [Cichlidogyrus casuarinus]|uniref:Transportin-3 n=1 Tax=Cichlidogyrus casuarinus TaxID=1844966 RepID=A0ABD2QMM6_9PLAT
MSFENVSLEQLMQAIDTLYGGSSSTEKDSASKWLICFQKSMQAWRLSDELLYKSRDLNSTYFAAQTLRNKIQSNFKELPVESHLVLKDSMLKHIHNINENTPTPISNQLLLAVTDLFLLMVVWKDAIQELVALLSQSSHGLMCLLIVLKFIPEELCNKTLHLGYNRKSDVIADLELNRKSVLELMSSNLTTGNENVVCKIFRCLSSWWDNLNIMRPSDISNSNLLEACFMVLKDPLSSSDELYESVSTWLVSLLYQCKVNRSGSSTDELLSFLQNNTYALLDIVRSCENQISHMTQEQVLLMQDRMRYIADIFSALARALKHHFLFSPSQDEGKLGDLKTLDCLISILDLSQPLGSRALVKRLLDAIHSVIYSASQHRFSNDRDSLTSIKLMMPYLSRIVIGFIRHCSSNIQPSETFEEFCAFRDDVYNIMQDLTPLIGAETIFTEVCSSH